MIYKPTRLGLDIGTTSIGWCLYELNENNRPVGILRAGVRIFSDGRRPNKGKASLAVDRRLARSARRRRDRYLRRRQKVMRALTEAGLFPPDWRSRRDLEQLDPYALRARGLDEELHPHHLGRALFHLNQRRGFQSNRKTDSKDSDSGLINQGVKSLKQQLGDPDAPSPEEKPRTLGEWLYQRHKKQQSVRVRRTTHVIDGKEKELYDFYPSRAMYEAEFDALWRAQKKYHPALLTDENYARLKDVIFFQRYLKPVQPGRCVFNSWEERVARAMPLAQEFRIYQELNNLKYTVGHDPTQHELTLEQRDLLAYALKTKAKMTFTQIRKALKLTPDCEFNLEQDNREYLKGDETAEILRKKDRFGDKWAALPFDRQSEIVDKLLTEQNEAVMIDWLVRDCGLDAEQAEKTSRAFLPDGHASLGPTAMRDIVEVMKKQVITYAQAARSLGYDHSSFDAHEIKPELEYYGKLMERHVGFGSGNPDDPDEVRYGRVPNPTVHIGLNQLRHLVNKICKKYGPPRQIIVELARELKLNKKQKDKINKEQKFNRERNERYEDLLSKEGFPNTGENRLRLKLWEELNRNDPFNRCCTYSGKRINIKNLFSDQVEIEHILPFSRTLDNSIANKTLSFRDANRNKGNQSPHEAFGHRPDWPDILERAAALPHNKRWRFGPDAMERFENEERDFLDRALTDTQYLSRLTREYLTHVCDQVWVIPGRLTALLRGKWGLNDLLSDHNLKDRTDHRHHAIDAAVVGVTDRSMLNSISRQAGQAEIEDLERLVVDMPVPWPTFRDDLKAALDQVIVSHRPDHNVKGALHNDTAYGLASDPDPKGVREVVHRVPLMSLKSLGKIETIRDRVIREQLLTRLYGLSDKEFSAELARYSKDTGCRRVRVVEKLRVIPIKNKNGIPYKGYKGDSNACYDIYELPNGKWKAEVISTFDANQGNFISPLKRQHPTARKIMRLFKKDMVLLKEKNGWKVMQVIKFSKGALIMAEHHESNVDQRHRNKDDPFKMTEMGAETLQKYGIRKAWLDELGLVGYPKDGA